MIPLILQPPFSNTQEDGKFDMLMFEKNSVLRAGEGSISEVIPSL
jgi:hypothetical protein